MSGSIAKPDGTGTPLLATHGLIAGYGDFQALFGIDFHIHAGEVVALIGANGAGKSTLLRSLMGLLRVAPAMVRFDGADTGGHAAHDMVKRGMAMVPEGRRLFAGMTVEENLRVAAEHARAISRRLRLSSARPPAGLLACASNPVCSSTWCAVSQASRSGWPPPKLAAVTRFSNTVMLPNGCGTW